MASFGFATILGASLFSMLCSVVAVPTSLDNYLNAVTRPLNSISNSLHSNHPAEHGPGFNNFDPLADLHSEWQTRSSHSTGEHATGSTAAISHSWPDWSAQALQPSGTSHYSPDTTTAYFNNQPWYPTATYAHPQPQPLEPWQQQHLANTGEQGSYVNKHQPYEAWKHTIDRGTSSSGGGAEWIGQHGAIEPWQQHHYLDSPGGGGSFDLADPPELSHKEIDEMVGLLNSPDVFPPSSSLPSSQAVQYDPAHEAAAGNRWRTGVPSRARNKARRAKLPNAVQATNLDLRRYPYLGPDGDSAQNPVSALTSLDDGNLLRHAQVIFAAEKTSKQTPLRCAYKGFMASGYVHGTDQQIAIVEELINRRLERSAAPNDAVKRVRVVADPNYTLNESNLKISLRRLSSLNEVATQGPFEALQDSTKTIRFDDPFTLGEYEIYVFGTRSSNDPPPVFALSSAASGRIRSYATTDQGVVPRKRPQYERRSIFLGHMYSV